MSVSTARLHQGIWSISAWRHHDQRVVDLPGVVLDDVDDVLVGADSAGELFRQGARRVAVHAEVDLRRHEVDEDSDSEPAADVAKLGLLAFIRDLTSHGVVVDWRVRFDSTESSWPSLTHLYPPTAIQGAIDGELALDRWRGLFHLCRCVYRVGPGFVQVRDRRTGELSRLTIDEPEYLEAVDQLLPGVSEQAVSPTILEDLAGESLLWRQNGFAVWLPYRVRRWPWPAMVA
ncbi:hypothetical protein GCM10009839_77970 [Catenulispora yoronensis]|uniref:Uncharacterized protein n=1 Tax=Catenulispora yoronensis TaxID=450799 RepID=A0ABP5GTS9_9ACTN